MLFQAGGVLNVFVNSQTFAYCGKPLCWETYLGQQFYRLAIMDFMVQLALVFFMDLPRVKLSKCFPFLGRIEFNLTKHALDVIYSHTIVWLSVFYVPLIVAITLVKSYLLLYLRIFYLRYVSEEIFFEP